MVRCLLLNDGLLKGLWVEVVNMVCYLINMSPRASLEGKVVEEVWIINPIDLDNFIIFRCSAYVHISGEYRSKLDPRSKKCVFVSYIKGVKVLKLWVSIKKKMVININVIFY